MSDIVAIEQLQWAYCHRVDRGTAAEVAVLFAPDGALRPAYDGPYELLGRAEIERWYAFYHENFRAKVRHLKHMITAPLIEIQPSGHATGRSYLLATAVTQDGSSGFYTTGTYHDEFTRRDGTWLFKSRRIEVEWMASHSTLLEQFPPLNFPQKR